MNKPSTGKRLIDALAHRPVDRPPFWFMRQAGRYLPEYRKIRAQVGDFLELCYSPEAAAEVTLQPIRRYGMDAAILFADILLIPDALGQKLEYREGEGPVLEPIRTGAGVAALDPATIHERLSPVYETVSRVAGALPDGTALIGFAGSPWTVACYMVEGHGSKEFQETRLWALRDPQVFGALIDVLVEATTAYLGHQIEAGAHAVQLFDSWSGVLSEDQFARWCVAPTQAIVSQLKQRYPDVPVIGFPRGAGSKTADYVAATGIDGVGIDTSMPVGWAARTLQSTVAIQGNLDPLAVVTGGKAMEDQARHILGTLSNGPFIFNLGHGIVPQTPPEHVAALSELIRNWRNA
ncbi:uroporphyrinogen decarboxylase [Emcibacter sp. SYSU 3D8]|uniref:uroporphyrinogen decarboxylase n=1 Tax=Emcibacter sp. SYSU 3D8 TaxID=3133969 RepID=UPI0031FEAE80